MATTMPMRHLFSCSMYQLNHFSSITIFFRKASSQQQLKQRHVAEKAKSADDLKCADFDGDGKLSSFVGLAEDEKLKVPFHFFLAVFILRCIKLQLMIK